MPDQSLHVGAVAVCLVKTILCLDFEVTIFLKLQVTQLDLHRHFHALGAGVIEEVRVQRDKNFGFVRYNTHAEAALAIQMGNAQSILRGRQIKVSLPD